MKNFSYVITINNPSEEEKDFYTIFKQNKVLANIAHCIYAEERGANDRPHMQAALYLIHPLHQKTIRSLFPRAHVEVSTGPYYSASSYCKKEGFYRCLGDLDRAMELDCARRAVKHYKASHKIMGFNSYDHYVGHLRVATYAIDMYV